MADLVTPNFKASLSDGLTMEFYVEELGPRRYSAEMLVEGGTLSEVTGSSARSQGATPDLAIRAFYQPGVVTEVYPADEPSRRELLAFWKKHHP